METFFIYLIKSIICLTVFLGIYIVFLRQTTFILFNRIYLLFGLLASLVIPAFKYTYDVMVNIDLTNNIVSENIQPIAAATPSGINWWQIVLLVYITGIVILFIRNISAYIKVTRLIRTGSIFNDPNGVKLVYNEGIKSPFSVVNYILLSTKDLSYTEKELIIKHEITHVKQKHWIDLICSQCMLMLQWFNPFVWLYISYLKENHEFLADKAVLDGGASPAVYQAVLINRQFGGPVFSFANSFNYSKPLTRLIMMKKTKSSPIRKAAILILIPMFGLFVWATAQPNYVVETKNVAGNAAPDSSKTIVSTSTAYITQEGDNAPFLQLGESLILEDGKQPLVIIDGKEYPWVNVSSIDPKYIESVSVLKDKTATEKYGDKAKNGVIEITLKEGYDHNALKKEKRTITYHATMKMDDSNSEDSAIVVYRSHPDGTVVTTTNAQDISSDLNGEVKIIKINSDKAEDIKGFINIMRNDNDTAKVKVTTKVFKVDDGNNDGKKGPVNIKVETIDTRGGGEPPIVIIDGKEVSFEEMNSLDTNKIESITVLKDKTSTEKYGDKAKNGVIVVETKKK